MAPKVTETYREFLLELMPPWMRGVVGELYTQALGFNEDILAETLNQAGKAHLLLSNTFHESTLKFVGTERLIPRNAAETDLGYLDRLHDAWEIWPKAGQATGEVEQLLIAGFTAHIFMQGQPGQKPGDNTGDIWNWDDNLQDWSRFWVVLTGHPFLTEGDWGDPGDYGDGGTWGTTATPEEVATVRGIVRRWKDAEAVFPHVIVVLDQAAWDALGTPAVTTGDRYDIHENRSDAARYWGGYGREAGF